MSGTTGYAKGRIQHAAIWNRALSDSEIMAIQTARTINPTPTPTPYPNANSNSGGNSYGDGNSYAYANAYSG